VRRIIKTIYSMIYECHSVIIIIVVTYCCSDYNTRVGGMINNIQDVTETTGFWNNFYSNRYLKLFKIYNIYFIVTTHNILYKKWFLFFNSENRSLKFDLNFFWIHSK